ncbi:hypothetical protein ACH5RR_018631 [Cinchona calisaya]|uniref:Tf2-1-like SH3-like domain-containing protein n=1 Tax=Cinchona calisaya TaxID=153742 RepID=A0ABD2ZM13_9GENT
MESKRICFQLEQGIVPRVLWLVSGFKLWACAMCRRRQKEDPLHEDNRSRGTFCRDQVYLKPQPYLQQSIELRKQLKLSSKFYGPYVVIVKIGKVTHRSQLPAVARLHSVAYISI